MLKGYYCDVFKKDVANLNYHKICITRALFKYSEITCTVLYLFFEKESCR